jgi:hypothetical protein
VKREIHDVVAKRVQPKDGIKESKRQSAGKRSQETGPWLKPSRTGQECDVVLGEERPERSEVDHCRKKNGWGEREGM